MAQTRYSNRRHTLPGINKKRLRTMAADCLEQIRASVSRLSASEKKLAGFILTNPHLLRDYSSLQLARAAELSQSSVVKFSQNLGYAGFTDLKLAIHESVLRKNAKNYRQQEMQTKASGSYQHLLAGSSGSHPVKTKSCSIKNPRASNLDRIENSLDTLSANERKLAKFLLRNAALIRDYSSQQVASSIRVSQSSVVKFSQKMGYRGFTDLKMAIHESVVRQGIGSPEQEVIASNQVSIEAFAALLNAKLAALQKTDAINDFEQIIHVANIINHCNNVHLLCERNYGPQSRRVVDHLAGRLTASGQPVLILEQSSDLLRLLDKGKPEVVIFVFDKHRADVMQFARQVRKSGAASVVIADHQFNALTNIPGSVLFYTSDTVSAFTCESAEASIVHLIDMVCSQLHYTTAGSSSVSVPASASKAASIPRGTTV